MRPILVKRFGRLLRSAFHDGAARVYGARGDRRSQQNSEDRATGSVSKKQNPLFDLTPPIFRIGIVLWSIVSMFALNCGAALNPARDFSPRLVSLTVCKLFYRSIANLEILGWLRMGSYKVRRRRVSVFAELPVEKPVFECGAKMHVIAPIVGPL